MNAADQALFNWLNADQPRQADSGKGREEARRLAKLCGVELTVRA